MKSFYISSVAFLCILMASAQTTGSLTVTATTSQTSNPSYRPDNIVAFWIEDSNGAFVKTLLAYASERKQYLTAWRTKTIVAGSVYNTTDAVTGATLGSHAARTASWNGKNRSQVTVPDGTYTVKMETTDNNGVAQNLASINFVKGTSSQTLTPANTNGYSSIRIVWTPSTTAIEELEENSLFRLYPTRTKSQLFVQGPAIKSIEITDINGRMLIHSKETNITVSHLPAAVYFATIYSDQGVFVRRFLKE